MTPSAAGDDDTGGMTNLVACSLPAFIICSWSITSLTDGNRLSSWRRGELELPPERVVTVASGEKEQRKRGGERMSQIVILVS